MTEIKIDATVWIGSHLSALSSPSSSKASTPGGAKSECKLPGVSDVRVVHWAYERHCGWLVREGLWKFENGRKSTSFIWCFRGPNNCNPPFENVTIHKAGRKPEFGSL